MRQRRRLLIGLLAVLLSCVTAGAVMAVSEQGTQQRQLDAAQARWAARPFLNYRMEQEEWNCTQYVEVHTEQVAQVTSSTRCQRNARTIGDLFDLIKRDQTVGIACITQGCACDDMLSIRASYDEQLGYPRIITVRARAVPNWRHPDYWHYTFANLHPPSCAMMEGDKRIEIHSLEALP